ncbi:MAG: TonB-dependent receptor [Pseudomonadales bacterium]
MKYSHKLHKLFALSAMAMAVTTTSHVVSAQEVIGLEEVIVSARKREESLQVVPLAIAALNAKLIDEKNISSTQDVARLISGLTFDEGVLPNDTRPVIRSVPSSRGRSNVGIMVDHVDITSESLTVGGGGMTGNLRLLDLERIEVVKGPQSALYGRSAFTGAINYRTKRPSEEFEGKVELNLDDNDTVEGKLAVSGPLSDNVRAGLTLSSWQTDGYYTNPVTGGDLNAGESAGGSLSLEWTPNDTFTAYGRVEASDDEYSPRAQVLRKSVNNHPYGLPYGASMDANGFDHGSLTDSAVNAPTENKTSFNPAISGIDGFGPENVAACADPISRRFPFAADPAAHGLCRPIITGPLSANASEVEISANPLTGRDFSGTNTDSLRLHLDLEWDWESVQFRSITAYTENDTNIQEDFDLTDYTLAPEVVIPGFDLSGQGYGPFVDLPIQYGFSSWMDIDHELEQFSQEFIFQGSTDVLDWQVSALYWEETLDTTYHDKWWMREGGFDTAAFVSPGFGAGCFGAPGVRCFSTATAPDMSAPDDKLSRETQSASLAGSLAWHINEAFTLTVEGRYLDEEIDYAGSGVDNRGLATAYGNCGGFTPFGVLKDDYHGDCGNTTNSVSFSEFIPRVSVDWQTSDDVMFYLTYAEGYKPGGVDTTNASTDVSVGTYDPEKLTSWELGTKTSWVDNSVIFNAAAFFYEYTDQQNSIQTEQGGFIGTTVVNAGEAEVKGVEFELNWLVTTGLNLGVSYTFADSEYTDYNLSEIAAAEGVTLSSTNNIADAGNAEADFTGNQMPQSAEHSANLMVRYEAPISDGMSGFAEVDGRYMSKRYISAGNNAYLPDYDIWNLSMGIDAESWRVILYIENLADDDSIQSGISNTDYGFDVNGMGGLSNAANLILPKPRTVGIRGTFRF